ncbi:MAG: patatin-like phospholipase family protein, partial [Myxococcota bacterium]
RQSAFGTKQLIVDYVDAVVEALEHLAVEESSGISRAAKRNFFRRASLCYGHTALMLSGSGTFFFFHIGVLRALLQEGLLPAILSGSSGGAAVAAMVGTRRPEDQLSVLTVDTFHHFIQNRRRTVPTSIHRKVIQKQQELLDEMLPDYTFEEAFETSGMAINVSIAPTDLHQSSRLLNAITSPHVCVRESVMASSAIPGIFPAVTLMAKSVDGQRQPYLPDRQWVDGSVSDDLPAKRLARLFGVNHYIVSQTNPHVLPFVTDANLDVGPLSVLRRTSQRTLRELLNGSAAMVLPSLTGRRRLTQTANMLLSVLNQDYLGDINILPPQPAMNPFRVLAYRSEDEAREMIRTGERATWPHLERIRIQTKVSRTLDRILATL